MDLSNFRRIWEKSLWIFSQMVRKWIRIAIRRPKKNPALIFMKMRTWHLLLAKPAEIPVQNVRKLRCTEAPKAWNITIWQWASAIRNTLKTRICIWHMEWASTTTIPHHTNIHYQTLLHCLKVTTLKQTTVWWLDLDFHIVSVVTAALFKRIMQETKT